MGALICMGPGTGTALEAPQDRHGMADPPSLLDVVWREDAPSGGGRHVRLVLCFVPLVLPYALIWSFLFPVPVLFQLCSFVPAVF